MGEKPRITIAGGGIGGMAAALSLLQRGYPVTVYEQAAELGLQEIVLTAPADAGIMESLTSFDWLRNERQT